MNTPVALNVSRPAYSSEPLDAAKRNVEDKTGVSSSLVDKAGESTTEETVGESDSEDIDDDYDDDYDHMGWGQALEGLAGAVAAAGVETVGNTASSLIKLPQAVGASYKALWNTEVIGPVLKTSIGMLLPAAAVLTPVLVALGSAGYGLFHGFTEGAKHGIGKAVDAATDDVKTFHKEVAGRAIQEIRKFETEKLGDGEKPFDISVVGGAKGLVAGAARGAVDAAGVGAVTLLHTPGGFMKALHEIWKSGAGLPMKTVATALTVPLAVLATPLGVVGGALYGLTYGAKDGYQKGLVPAVTKSLDDVSKYNRMVSEAIYD